MIEQCPYPLTSGVQDAEIISGFCEIGCNCHPKCQWSWDDEDERKVNKVFETYSTKMICFECRRDYFGQTTPCKSCNVKDSQEENLNEVILS